MSDKLLYAIAIGNIADGFSLFGIFPDEQTATEYGRTQCNPVYEDWNVIPIFDYKEL